MSFDSSTFRERPQLVKEFLSGEWSSVFSAKTMARASGYAKGERLSGMTAKGYRASEVTLTCQVRGSYQEVYETDVFFYKEGRNWAFYTECSCPVGDDCKHAAAMLIRLELELKAGSVPSSQPNSDVMLTNWLNSLDETLQVVKEQPAKKPPKKILLYCLERQDLYSGSEYRLCLRTARFLKSGALSVDKSTRPQADPLRPSAYMQPEDTFLCTLYHQQARVHYSYQGLPLKGDVAGRLLSEIMKSAPDRFFVLEGNCALLALELGEEVKPIPTWIREDDGSMKPGWEEPLGALEEVLATEPAFALVRSKEEGFCLYPLGGERYSLSFLQTWSEGPTVAPDQVAVTAQFLQKKPQVPTPEAPDVKELSAVEPEVSLRVYRKNPFTHGGLHFSGQPEPVIAEMSFRYHGHFVAAQFGDGSLSEESFFVNEKGVLLKVPRDDEKEREAAFLLEDECGLTHAAAWDDAVATGLEGAFLPVDEVREWDEAAVRFVSSSVPVLREKGWKVTVDSSAEFEVQRVEPEGLQSGFEESPDAGPDWFHFSASYLTPDGKQQPLLPLLTSFLQNLDFETIEANLQALPDENETLLRDPENPQAFLLFPTKRLLALAKALYDLFGGSPSDAPIHKLQAATLADTLEMDSSATLKALAALGKNLKDISTLPRPNQPKAVKAELRDYQLDGFHWMQFLARHSLHGILADDMGLGKTLQGLTHLQAEVSGRRTQKRPSLVIAPTSVVSNWINESTKFTPKLKTLLLQGAERKERFSEIPNHHLVVTSYALLVRDFEVLKEYDFHLLILDEAQYIKNPAAKVSQLVCKLTAAHRLALSGTPLENHLGELWSQMRFLMPGILGSSEVFNRTFRTPIEKHQDSAAQMMLNSRVAPLMLRRTKEQVATELPPKTEILHTIPLTAKQVDLYETVRAAMDDRVKEAIASKGLAKSQIVVLDALLKLRQICCHPQLLKLEAAQKVKESAKLDFLTKDLLPTLLEEGRKVLIFSTFTTMLQLIEDHLKKENVLFSKITGKTRKRDEQIESFQEGKSQVFLISLKAGGTGLNLTAADTVIHYDPWWNPAAENQATDRAYRIGQDKPVFVHKLISEGAIEERIVELQARKAKLVEALLSEKTSKLQIDQETLGNLFAPLG